MKEVTARSVPGGWEPRGASAGNTQESTFSEEGRPREQPARGSAEERPEDRTQEKQARRLVLGVTPRSHPRGKTPSST